jgi:hypothetical protein
MGITLATSITDEYTIEYQTNASANDYLLKQYTDSTIDLTKYIIAYTVEYTTPGSYNPTIPQWCSSIACILIGGGGGGGSSDGTTTSSSSQRGGGGGGAGGSLVTSAFTVSASANISITVGAAGTSSPDNDGVNGGNSSLTVQTITYTAVGGGRGTRGVSGVSYGQGGAGGGISGPVPSYYVIGNVGSNSTSVAGGPGGGRTELNQTTSGPKYCENFIATGMIHNSGTGYGAGGGGGGFITVLGNTTKLSPANGTAGYAKVYFYI